MEDLQTAVLHIHSGELAACPEQEDIDSHQNKVNSYKMHKRRFLTLDLSQSFSLNLLWKKEYS